MGKIDNAKSIIPIPPNHCNKDLHKSMPFGKLSNPVMTVAPVVVTPLIDSKKAFVKERRVSEYMNGIELKKETAIQENTVSRKACLKVIFLTGFLNEKINTIPIKKVKKLENKKTFQSWL